MATSTGINVLRYTALATGVFYGFYHQATLNSAAKKAAIQHEYEHKQSLIEKAKAEFVKKSQPPQADSLIRDPNDSRFDLEAYLTAVAAEAK